MLKKRISVLLAVFLAVLFPLEGLACTTIYAGSELTEDGSTLFARLEEYGEAWSKLFDVMPEGAHGRGEVYTGCYGFSWVFTHDSYGYTAFCDNNSQGICPDCEGTHAHTPYQAAGTNSRGLSVTATETLTEKEAVMAVDPFNTESGIEEAEIPTILLGEAASAREAMLLLTSIYASTGAYGAGSVIVADSEESWYIESLSGTQYLAVRLNAGILFVCPNISVIGLIDLNDRENVLASDGLIETAVKAGTFVGNAEKGLIDFAASYDDSPDIVYLRLAAGLNHLAGEAVYPEDLTSSGIDGGAFRISNVDAEGKTVAPYTNIRLKKKLGVRDVMTLYQQEPISRHRSLETHIFQISDGTAHGTVEWVSMADNRTSVFVPYYPMETAEVFAPFHADTVTPEHLDEKPAEGPAFCMSDGAWARYPDGWQDSWYWVFSRLEHIARDNEEAAASIRARLDALQDQICASEETGNQAAQTVWLSVRQLLEELE